MKTYTIGERVTYLAGGSWKPSGEIVEVQPAIIMNGATLSGARYRVKWDNDDESGWLSHYDIETEHKETL